MVQVQQELPKLQENDNSIEACPQAVLEQCTKNRQEEVLIHWKGLSPSDATWENSKHMKLRFSEYTFEDKGENQGEGMVYPALF